MPRQERWQNKNVDLKKLASNIENYCVNNDFRETKITEDSSLPPTWFEVQAMKTDTLRTIVGARRCLDIVIKGHPNDFEVTLALGDWGKNLAASVITGTLTLGIGFIAAGASAVTYKMFEDKLWGYISEQVTSLTNSAVSPQVVPSLTPLPPPPPPPVAEVYCPSCGKPATYIPQYQRYYCYNCRQYLSQTLPPPP